MKVIPTILSLFSLLGNIRLEAATGEDFSPLVNIPKPDGMMERALQFVKWLAKDNPPGCWDYFLTEDKQALRWDTSARATTASSGRRRNRGHGMMASR